MRIAVLSIVCRIAYYPLIFELLFEIRFVILGIKIVYVGKSSPI